MVFSDQRLLDQGPPQLSLHSLVMVTLLMRFEIQASADHLLPLDFLKNDLGRYLKEGGH